jgi:hypothetical protein
MQDGVARTGFAAVFEMPSSKRFEWRPAIAGGGHDGEAPSPAMPLIDVSGVRNCAAFVRAFAGSAAVLLGSARLFSIVSGRKPYTMLPDGSATYYRLFLCR